MRRILIMVRAGYGALLLLGPDGLLCKLSRTPVDARALAVARVLGARELLQAELTRRHPTRRWLRAGVWVDAAHATSMVALARADPARRALAMRNAVTAASLALAGAAAAYRAPAPASRS